MDKILVFGSNEEIDRKIKMVLSSNYEVFFTYVDIYNYTSQINRYKPNLILVLSSTTSFNLLSKLISTNIAILLIRDSQFIIDECLNLENFYYLDKNRMDFLYEIVKIIIKDNKNILSLKKKNEELKNKIEEDRLIKRAKLFLIEKGMSEEEAYKYIIQSSMQKRMPKKDICMRILNE